MTIVQTLSDALAPWQNLFSDSTLVSASVTTAHVVTLLFAGGLAIAADRSSLRAVKQSAEQRSFMLGELGAVHRPVLIAIVALFISGLLLAAADVETFATSWIFWLKMGLVVLLLVNGVLLLRTESKLGAGLAEDDESDPGLWRQLACRSRTSLALWALITIAGTVLTNA